ncbi:MAG: LEA type 2 family protein [Pseudomonas sp.]
MRLYRSLFLALVTLALAGCGGGMVRRVSEPTASIQQLSVRADGSWSLELRLQNYSSIPMRFERVALDVQLGAESAGRLEQTVGISIGPESADIVQISLQPSSFARLAIADVLAGHRSLPYVLKGKVWATPEEKKQREFDIDARNTLSPAPGLDGVLR